MCFSHQFEYGLCGHGSDMFDAECPFRCDSAVLMITMLPQDMCDDCMQNAHFINIQETVKHKYEFDTPIFTAMFGPDSTNAARKMLSRALAFSKNSPFPLEELFSLPGDSIFLIQGETFLEAYQLLTNHCWKSYNRGVTIASQERRFIVQMRKLLHRAIVLHKAFVYEPSMMSRYAASSMVLQKITKVDITTLDATNNTCPISGDQYDTAFDGETPQYPVKLDCPGSHTFGNRLVSKWLEARGTCPMCRHQVIPRLERRFVSNNAFDLEKFTFNLLGQSTDPADIAWLPHILDRKIPEPLQEGMELPIKYTNYLFGTGYTGDKRESVVPADPYGAELVEETNLLFMVCRKLPLSRILSSSQEMPVDLLPLIQ